MLTAETLVAAFTYLNNALLLVTKMIIYLGRLCMLYVDKVMVECSCCV